MSFESLNRNKKVSWVQPDHWNLDPAERAKINPLLLKYARKKGEFGPPVFDERKRTYYWRNFKKGFNWGFIIMT